MANPLVVLASSRLPLRFFYRRLAVRDMRSLALEFNATPARSRLPVAIWTEFSIINGHRRDAVGASRPTQRRNPPVWATTQRRHRALTPADPWQDPYILALLISVAQEQRIALLQEGLWDRPSFQVRKSPLN
jgi:hypothetical protein